MDAEHDIEGSPGAPGRSAGFAPGSAAGFMAGCGGGGDQRGLCLSAPIGEPPVWQRVDLSDADEETSKTVPYGYFTGAQMQTGEGFLPFRRPRYLIELVPDTAAGAAPHYLYRVTAIGFGSRPHTEVVLQTIYRKHGGSGAGE